MLVAARLVCAPTGHAAPPAEAATSAIVPAADTATATRLVAAVGDIVAPEPGIIRAVGVRRTAAQRDRLAGLRGVLRFSGRAICRHRLRYFSCRGRRNSTRRAYPHTRPLTRSNTPLFSQSAGQAIPVPVRPFGIRV